MTDENHTEIPAFSRSIGGNPMGKLLDELKTKVDPDTALAFRKKVHDAGTDSASAIRDFIYNVVHGETYTDMCIREAKINRDRLFGTGLSRDLARTHE